MTTPTNLDRLEEAIHADVGVVANLSDILTRRRDGTPWWKPWTRHRLALRIGELQLVAEVYDGVLRRIAWQRLNEDARAESEAKES